MLYTYKGYNFELNNVFLIFMELVWCPIVKLFWMIIGSIIGKIIVIRIFF
jgi:hypothetical protein